MNEGKTTSLMKCKYVKQCLQNELSQLSDHITNYFLTLFTFHVINMTIIIVFLVIFIVIFVTAIIVYEFKFMRMLRFRETL